MTEEIILDNVSKRYVDRDAVWAVRDFSLKVEAGEFVCLVGPSGCGKSTLLKLIANLEAPSSGSISAPGRISMVFQNGALFPWLTAEENVAFGLQNKHLSRNQVKEESKKYLKMVNLAGLEGKFPRELSGGQRQRVGIARALAAEPQVLLLDEPFSALDTITTDELHRDLLQLWQELQMSVVMVSHSLEEAVYLADKIVIMNQGGVKEVLVVNLPRPRREKNLDYLNELAKVKRAFPT